MRQAELDAIRKRDVFEGVCAEALLKHFPMSLTQAEACLLSWRAADGYTYNGADYTGRTMCQMANVAWACWKSACLIG
jgi:hypothetical protein